MQTLLYFKNINYPDPTVQQQMTAMQDELLDLELVDQCVAGCCRALQGVAGCCSVLRSAAVCCSSR